MEPRLDAPRLNSLGLSDVVLLLVQVEEMTDLALEIKNKGVTNV